MNQLKMVATLDHIEPKCRRAVALVLRYQQKILRLKRKYPGKPVFDLGNDNPKFQKRMKRMSAVLNRMDYARLEPSR